MEFQGMDPLVDDDPGAIAFRAGGRVVDLRSRYSLIAVDLGVERGDVGFLLFGEGSVRRLRVLGATSIHLSRWSAEPEQRWVTFATDGDIALSVLGSGLEFGLATDRDETVASDVRLEDGWILQPWPVALSPDETWVLSRIEIDAINRIVRVAARSERSPAHLEFQDVTSYRLGLASTSAGRSARIGREDCTVVGLGESSRRSRAGDPRTFSVSTSGGLEFSVTASVQLSRSGAQP